MIARITHGARVTMHYSLDLADGTVIESTRDGDPETVTIGGGDMDEGLESCLYGLEPGDEREFVIAPGAVFGSSAKQIEKLPRTSFNRELDIEPGRIVSFETPAGREAIGTIESVSDDGISVNFAHPLAGRALQFRVRIIAVSFPI
jgi:FKBP-type peptidyl-prolyl cis-trans isomerase SlpA